MKTSVRKNDKSTSKNSVFTAETLGVVFVLFAAFAFICLISRDKIFSAPGQFINRFLLGSFGYFAYPITLYFIVRGIMLIAGKKMPGSFKVKGLAIIALLLVAAIVHAISMHGNSGLGYGEYLSLCYTKADGGVSTCSGGGIVAGLYTYLFTALLTDVGAYVILCVLIALTAYGFYKVFSKKTAAEAKESEPNGSFTVDETQKTESEPERSASAEPTVAAAPTAKLYVANSDVFELKSKKDLKAESGEVKFSYANNGLGVAGVSYTTGYSSDLQSKIDYIKTPAKIVPEREEPKPTTPYSFGGVSVSEPIPKAEPEEKQDDTPIIPLYEHDEVKDDTLSRAEDFNQKYVQAEEMEGQTYVEPESTFYPSNDRTDRDERVDFGDNAENVEDNSENEESFSDDVFKSTFGDTSRERNRETFRERTVEPEESVSENELPQEIDETEESETEHDANLSVESEITREPMGRRARDFFKPAEPIEERVEEPKAEEKPPKEIPPINREYFRPPLDLLASPTQSQTNNGEDHEERIEIIRKTLEEFRIEAEPQGYIQGPAITQYAFKIPAGVVVSKVLGYADNLQMRLAVKDGIRIQAPIPGKDLIGIEVANKHREMITLRELMESPAAAEGKPSELMFAIGKSIVGKCVFDNLAKGVHYLVAGSTGSGKSVCLHALITSLIMRYSPEDLRLIFIDPKQVEFRVYEHLPHLMSDEIISDPKRVIAVLSWAIEEMERRYSLFAEGGGLVDNIESYNEYIASDTVPRLPRIVIVVDELADLMSVCKKDLEARIARLTAKARAAGIHLVLTTQRPSVDVITGVIKSNLPSRIALKVSNFNDSQTIMNEAGAEKLLGNGDMLYKNASMNNFERYLGAYVSKMEIFNVVKYIKEHNKAYFDDDFKEYLENTTNPKPEEAPAPESADGGDTSDANAEIFKKALAFAINNGKVSISLIQRRFQIGYIRAAGLIDKMEQSGYIAPSEGSKSRTVYITREQFEEKFGPLSEA
ncbi:MAG: DNA translocase FtsK [Clostridia bacterium]|nr:DNA translocase FtsK [Clostridia bacterium]